ncbi:hypothetical protein H0H87_001887 [Tephrocybe sp. NHM501043]|nr:hypothetical protein H0H87_001887 [Tephrocybe sp. NHM501043]
MTLLTAGRIWWVARAVQPLLGNQQIKRYRYAMAVMRSRESDARQQQSSADTSLRVLSKRYTSLSITPSPSKPPSIVYNITASQA